jgi:uncharacterized protein (TIGR03067 family)
LEKVLMRVQLLVALACSFLVSTGRAADPAAAGDKDRIQGTWSVVSGEHGGKPIPAEVARNVKLVFAGNKLTTMNKDRKTEATFKLDPDKKPKEIDVDMDGNVGKGIYQLDGDNLKIAHGEVGDPRPKDFPEKEGSGLTVLVLKREKP